MIAFGVLVATIMNNKK
ncbi:hypothetical protein ACQRD4_02675 [Streptococcus hyointestinalis]|nr:hypothetical protein [Streptococcus hyointestinalis]MCI6872492.1 hypothetical protein [Streptococcus hyointestinalis]